MADTRAELFARRVAQQSRRWPGYQAAWNRFAAVLLVHGGEQVVPPLAPDLLVDVFRTHGRVWPTPARFVEGRASACHHNAVALWRSGEAAAMGSGYALSEDRLWREHTWGIAHDGQLIETTEPRTAYFGIELRDGSAERFARWIEGGTPPAYRRTFGWSRLPVQLASRVARRRPGR
jgi:hypothetical protein